MASLISLSLFQLLKQVRRAVSRITHVIEVDGGLSGFYNQFEKDVTGMFTPQSTIEFFAQDKKADQEKRVDQPAEKQPKKSLTELSKPIEHVFIANVRQEEFFLSFITTGGIQVLDADGRIAPVPFVRRVASVLEKDPQRAGTYRLMYRFSGTRLELEPFRLNDFTPSYELLSSIKTLTLEMSVLALMDKETGPVSPDEPTTKDSGARKAAVVPSRTIALKVWDTKSMWETYKTLIPAYVKVSGIRADAVGIEYPFEIAAKVYAYSPYVEKEKSLFEALEDIARRVWKKS